MNIDMTRTRRTNNTCPECTRCLHYKGEGIYCIGDKKPCWNWEYDREKDPCDPAYLSPRFRKYLAPGPVNIFEPIVPHEELLGMINDLVYQDLNLVKMMQYKEERNETLQSND